MKKLLLSVLVISILLVSCTSDRKSEKKEKEIIEQQIKKENESVEEKSSKEENLQKTQEKTDISSGGSSENQKEEKKREKSVTPSQKDKKEEKSITELLKEGIGASDDNVIKNGKVFNYKSEKGEKIKVIFKTYDDKRNYIIVKRPEKPNLELDQNEAWAKGAIYKRDTIRMDFDFDKATLIIGDKHTDYVGDKEISN